MAQRFQVEVPADLHGRLELDADYAEALWALGQPPGSLDLRLMLRDTLAALEQLPEASTRLRKHLPSRTHPILAQLEVTVSPGSATRRSLQHGSRPRSPKSLSTRRAVSSTSWLEKDSTLLMWTRSNGAGLRTATTPPWSGRPASAPASSRRPTPTTRSYGSKSNPCWPTKAGPMNC